VSKLEDRVASALQAAGAPSFVRQHTIRDVGGRFAAALDFFFPEQSTCLEVNGTFWHADPRVYPVIKHPIQRKCVDRYNRKLELLKTLGIRVVEAWEVDLRKDMAGTVRQVLDKVLG
jgi:G:T-mismatch repair DNA endonuclease (very short patch repair protein)